VWVRSVLRPWRCRGSKSVLLRVALSDLLFQIGKALGVTPRLIETLERSRAQRYWLSNVLWTTIVEQTVEVVLAPLGR
jgi:hypothetical protein